MVSKKVKEKAQTSGVSQKVVVPPKKKRQRLPAAERKAQIIKAAQRVFVRQGFHGTRTRDLADEAGVNEATLFLYFENKQQIFDSAINEPLKALVKIEMEDGNAFAAAIDAQSKEKIGVEGILDIYRAVVELYPLLTSALFFDRELGKETYKSVIFPMIEKLRIASRKSFRVKDDESAEFIVLAAFGLCFMMHMHHDLRGKKENIENVAKRISNLLLYGLMK